MAEKNQNDKEFFALVGTGRKGVESMLATMGPEIAKVAAPNVGGNFEIWSTRALVEIANRDELRGVLQSREGIFSVYKALTKAATMGLQIGGQFPHAYLVPKEGKAVLVPTKDGYSFAAVHGPGAVLKAVPELVKIFDDERVTIDQAAGKLVYPDGRNPFPRGKLLGYAMVLEYRDGHIEIPSITREKVEAISKAYSQKEFGGGKKAPAWAKSEDEMYEKIAAKQLLKKPVKESEGLAMLLGLDDYEAPEYHEPPRDIGDRLSSRLDMRTVEPEEDEPTDTVEGDGSGEALPPIEDDGKPRDLF